MIDFFPVDSKYLFVTKRLITEGAKVIYNQV